VIKIVQALTLVQVKHPSTSADVDRILPHWLNSFLENTTNYMFDKNKHYPFTQLKKATFAQHTAQKLRCVHWLKMLQLRNIKIPFKSISISSQLYNAT